MADSTPPEEDRRFAPLVYVCAAIVLLFGVGFIGAAIGGAAGWAPTKAFVSGVEAGNVATFTVAGATLILADFTALLAWFTWESIRATRREAKIAEQALAAARRHADIADESLKAVQDQAKIAERQVAATNKQADVAQDQLTASWRPLLVEPRVPDALVEVKPTLERAFGLSVRFLNIGKGPAFIRKAFLSVGVAGSPAAGFLPAILEPGAHASIPFSLSPTSDGVDRAIANALMNGTELAVYALYHDIGRRSAWRSRARLARYGINEIQRGDARWILSDVEVTDADLTDLD